jgi:phosphoribosylglycinamide formyltransferase 2
MELCRSRGDVVEVIVEAFVKFNSEITINRGAKQQSNFTPYWHVKNARTIKKLAAALISDKGIEAQDMAEKSY